MSNADSVKKCYEVLLEEHAKLRGLLAALKQVLTQRTADIGEVVRRLRELSDMIDEHFKSEEESECFEELVNHAPRVLGKVNELLGEHGELRAEIVGLVQRATDCDGSDSCWKQLSDDFAKFMVRLMRHEDIENELVQAVFTEDIGSKD